MFLRANNCHLPLWRTPSSARCARSRLSIRCWTLSVGRWTFASRMPNKAELIVEERKIQVSNLDKVLYPKVGFTKGQVIDYYIRVAPVLLPHLKDRPLTMKRYPNGVEGEFFYEKNCPSHRPKWVKTAKVWSEGNQRIMNYCLAQ